jgi:hypothetical protein
MNRTLICTLLLCAFASSRSTSAAETNVAKLAAAYASPEIGAASAVDQATFRVGNLTLQLTHGDAAPVTVGGAQVGFFFSGKGSYAYHSTDALESSLVLFEAKRLGRKADAGADRTITLSGEFDEVYVAGGAIEFPKPGEPSPHRLNDAFAKHVAHFAATRWTPPSHLLIRQRLDAPASQVAVAELGAGGEDNGYVLDTIDRKSEGFYALMTHREANVVDSLRGAIFALHLAEQPVGGRRRADFLQPRYLLRNVDYTLVAGDRDSGKLSVTENIVGRNDAQSVLRFEMASTTIDSGLDAHHFHVDSVTDGAGKQLAFHHDRSSLLVSLPAKLEPKAETTLHFEISGDFLYRAEGHNYWQLGTYAWFPQPDYNGQYYTVHSTVSVKKPWIAFAPGDTIARREEGSYNVLESRVDKPVQYEVVHAGAYTVASQQFDKLAVEVVSYNGANPGSAKQLATLAHEIIAYYEPFLGPFPFRELHIIQLEDLGFGQAPPSIMFITREAFNPALTTENRAYSKGINQRFAHEIAHQYWGIVTKKGSEEEEWLAEGFAEYVSSLVEKELKGQGAQNTLIAHWRADAKDAGTFAPIPLANRVDTFDESSYTTRTGLLYGKGAYLLAVIHKTIGDEKFLTFLRTVQGRFAWRFLTTKDVVETLSKIDGKEWQPFFDRYYLGAEMPPMPR